MKHFRFIVLLLLAHASAALAGESDLRMGTYEGKFGGFPCRYELTSQTPGKISFTGKIYLYKTKQYDRIVVTQQNGLVRVLRQLSGQNSGKGQTVRFHAAESKMSTSGKKYFMFRSAESAGPGMEGTASYFRMDAK